MIFSALAKRITSVSSTILFEKVRAAFTCWLQVMDLSVCPLSLSFSVVFPNKPVKEH